MDTKQVSEAVVGAAAQADEEGASEARELLGHGPTAAVLTAARDAVAERFGAVVEAAKAGDQRARSTSSASSPRTRTRSWACAWR